MTREMLSTHRPQPKSVILSPMRLAMSCLLIGVAGAAMAQQITYPVFETDKIPIAELKARREKVKSHLGANGVEIFFTNPERNRNNDCDFRFRADSNFLYLTGFEEPDAALVLAPDGIEIDGKTVSEVLLVNESDPYSVTWLGYRMGSKEAKPLLGMEAVLPNNRLPDLLKALAANKKNRYYNPFIPPSPSGHLKQMIDSLAEWTKGQNVKTLDLGPINSYIASLRVNKSAAELAMLKRAAEASAMGHREVFKSVKPGMREYELMALVEYVFARNGCESVGYNSIVGSGPNSCILHYEEDRRLIEDGDMICMDAAGEFHGYSADVTRSFPANGKFSPAQKAIYEIVLAAQTAGIAQCKAGNGFGEPGNAAFKVVTEGLMKLGIIKNASEVGTYLPHGISHYIGLDVHDAHGDNTLKPNYVLTVEPGIYIRAGSKCDPKYWNIGVRIEDDILVTAQGPVNLSAGVPRTVDEIEALMKKTGIGKKPVGQ